MWENILWGSVTVGIILVFALWTWWDERGQGRRIGPGGW